MPIPIPEAQPEHHDAAATEYDLDAAAPVDYDPQAETYAEGEYPEEAALEPTLEATSAQAPALNVPPPTPQSVRERAAAFFQDKPKAPEKAPVMPENPNKNILSKDVEIKGNIKFTNELVIDGKIEGEISSDGVLTVGENADIRGEIKTKSVTVLGKVNGNITVTERCELKARAHLVGDLKAARLVIEEGATFIGKSEVTLSKGVSTSKGSSTVPVDAGAKPEEPKPAFVGNR